MSDSLWITKKSKKNILLDKMYFMEKCKHGDENIYKELNANTNKINRKLIKSNNYKGFRLACEHGHLSLAQFLLSKLEPSVYMLVFKSEKYYAYHYACINGHLSTVEWLYKINTELQLETESINTKYKINYNFIFEQMCQKIIEEKQYNIIHWLFPKIKKQNLMLIINNDCVLDKVKYQLIDLIKSTQDSPFFITLFEIICFSGKLTIAQYIYTNSLITELNYKIHKWDKLFKRIAYKVYELRDWLDKIEDREEILGWIISLFPTRYFKSENKYYVVELKPRIEIPIELNKVKTICSNCNVKISDIITSCGHQLCNECLHNSSLHDACFILCPICTMFTITCYQSSYDYTAMKLSMRNSFYKELMINRFQPKNITKFSEWGIDGF